MQSLDEKGNLPDSGHKFGVNWIIQRKDVTYCLQLSFL